MLFSNHFLKIQKLFWHYFQLLNCIENETWQHCDSDHSFIALSVLSDSTKLFRFQLHKINFSSEERREKHHSNEDKFYWLNFYWILLHFSEVLLKKSIGKIQVKHQKEISVEINPQMSNFRTECRNAWVRMVVLVRDESARARVRSIAYTRKKKKQRKTTETNRNQRAHARKQKQKPSVVRGLNFRFISYRVRPIRKNWILVLFIYFFRYKKRKTFCNPVGFTFLFVSTVKNAHFSFLYFLFVCVCCATKKFMILFSYIVYSFADLLLVVVVWVCV